MSADTSKIVSIIQSSYIPWRGYFDIIDQSDCFILLDDVQYTKRDWRNRNKIPTPQGEKWLSVPVQVKGKYFQKICEVEVSDAAWYKSHWGIIENNYRKAPFFKDHQAFVRDLFMGATQSHLSGINHHLLSGLCDWLGIDTPLTWSMDYDVDEEDATERLVQLCVKEGATTYISGPAAKSYLDESSFNRHGIEVRFFDYGTPTPYPQIQETFSPFVSIVDMIFMCGAPTMDLIRNDRAALGE